VQEGSSKQVIVIGAGYGGIAAALRAKRKGYQVKIIERCSEIGGRAQYYQQAGFNHDAGPTVITAPFLLEELFGLFNENLHDYVTLKPLSPWYQFQFYEGTTFNYGGTLEATLDEINKINPKDVDGYLKLLKHAEKIFDVGFTQLAHQPFVNFTSMLKITPKMIQLKNHQSVWQFVGSYIRHPLLRQAFSVHPLLIGGNPFNTTSIYSLIHFLEHRFGVWFAMGGTHSITKALKQLLEKNHIEILTNTTVNEILIDKQKVCGVRTERQSYQASKVISNVDPGYCYQNMIDTKHHHPMVKFKVKTNHYSMGLFLLYFGTTQSYPQIKHHTIVIGEHFKQQLHAIFNQKHLTDDLSMYIHRPTATDPLFAPPGCDSFYVLVPVPNNLSNINWLHQGPVLRQQVIEQLSQTLLPNLRQHITADFFKTPDDFQDQYLSPHGAGFSITPLFRQSAWFRFHNQDKHIDGLYHVGAGTHPGAGIPGVLSSAKVVDCLLEDIS
jgi:phytoene desaturase